MKNKNNILDKENKFSLHNLENYNHFFNYESDEIIEKYILLLSEFLNFILEKTKIKNTDYFKFIITRGYETITNVFNIILYFTKNLDLTFYHCQKGYYYYIEFIEQISYEQHIFLQLNSKDATTYVYKKTIFELNNNIKENTQSCPKSIRNKLDLINEYIKIFKNIFDIFIEFIEFEEFEDKNHLSNNNIIINKFTTVCEKLYSKYKNSKNKNLYNNIELLNNEYYKYNTNNKETIVNDYFEYIIQKM